MTQATKKIDRIACVMVDIWGRASQVRRDGFTLVKWDAEYYTYKMMDDDAFVRDEIHCGEVCESLLGKSSIWRGEKPEKIDGEFVPWFSVIIIVSETRKRKSHYVVDYHSYPGAPLEIIDQGMGIYRLVKRNLKNAIKRGLAK